MSRLDRAAQELRKLLDLFETGNVPEAVAKVLLPSRDVPCARWSLANRMLCLLSGTDDARGYRQWEEAGRYVKKATKAFYILAPRFAKRKPKDGETTNPDNPDMVLVGFRGVPVFRFEDTDGEPLERPEYRPPDLPPLFEVAERFGVKVEYLGHTLEEGYYGYYRPDSQEIRLCTHHESTFFHELAHAAHHRVKGSIKPGQDWKQEIVAELSATVLCRLHGLEYEGNAYKYIGRYAEKAKKDVYRACLAVLSDVEKVLAEILTPAAIAA